MGDENYYQLLDLLSKTSGISIEELERRIEAKRAKLSGLISKEGALQVVAAELNINFDKQLLKISQIVPGMRKINTIGKIISLNPIREYTRNGRNGRIASFILADETSNIRVVLWDENHIDLIASGQISEGSVIEINNASLRNGELHLTSFSEIKLSSKNFDSLVLEKPPIMKKIKDLNAGEEVSIRAFILNIFEPRFFDICPECKKRVTELNECNDHGKIIPLKRVLLNFIVDDGTDSIRVVFFSEELEKIISFEELSDPELFSKRKKELLGKELIFYGQVRKNSLYNIKELIAFNFEEVDLDKLIEELEAKN